MSDTKTIVGVCSGITEKPTGWTEFEIQVEGNNYPTRLSTKLDTLISAARETKGGIATWTFNEVESEKVNPNSGKPYKNRYLEKVELGAAPLTNGAPEPKHNPVHYADKDRAISRMACLKAAALHPVGDVEDWGLAVITEAARFERWLYRDIDPVPFDVSPERSAPIAVAGGAASAAVADDDIPFAPSVA